MSSACFDLSCFQDKGSKESSPSPCFILFEEQEFLLRRESHLYVHCPATDWQVDVFLSSLMCLFLFFGFLNFNVDLNQIFYRLNYFPSGTWYMIQHMTLNDVTESLNFYEPFVSGELDQFRRLVEEINHNSYSCFIITLLLFSSPPEAWIVRVGVGCG